MSLLCPTCAKPGGKPHPLYGRTACRKCLRKDEVSVNSGRRPLTDYERMKLGWYRNEKKWIENIQDRKTVIDNMGNKVTVSQGKIMPIQPRKYWPKPKGGDY